MCLETAVLKSVVVCVCRLAAVKKAADAANRKICFVGMSLNTYLEAAASEGQAPFHPRDLIPVAELESHDPNEVLIVTTGSQVITLPLSPALTTPLLSTHVHTECAVRPSFETR